MIFKQKLKNITEWILIFLVFSVLLYLFYNIWSSLVVKTTQIYNSTELFFVSVTIGGVYGIVVNASTRLFFFDKITRNQVQIMFLIFTIVVMIFTYIFDASWLFYVFLGSSNWLLFYMNFMQ